MENEIDNLYPKENEDFQEELSESAEQAEPQHSVPSDFHYTPVEIPHRVDWFVILLSWIIIGVLCYVMFKTSVFE